jgi:hypothetical protein
VSRTTRLVSTSAQRAISAVAGRSTAARGTVVVHAMVEADVRTLAAGARMRRRTGVRMHLPTRDRMHRVTRVRIPSSANSAASGRASRAARRAPRPRATVPILGA